MSLDNVIHYNPPGPVARAFMLSDKRIRVLSGPFGSGKSVTCVMEIMRRAMMQEQDANEKRKTRFAVVRNTMPQLRDTTIKTFHEWIPPGVAGRWKETDKTFLIKFNDVECEVMFRALDDKDDVQKLLSLELTGAWLNECREIAEEIVRGIDGRIGRYPSKKNGKMSWCGIIADTNMPNEDTYWQSQMEGYVDDPAAHFKKWGVFKQPSGLSPEAENLDNLNEGQDYYKNLATDSTPDFIRVNVHAEYGRSLSGKPVYERTFDSDVHVAKTNLLYNPFKQLMVGMDFGRDPSCIFGQYTPDARFVLLEELCKNNMGLESYISGYLKPFIRERFPDIEQDEIIISGDPSGQFGSQYDERTCFSILKKAGFKVYAPRTNSIGPRLEAVEYFLTTRIPGLTISKNCSKIIQGFKSKYHYAKKTSGDFADKPDKNEWSHPHDALQYLCMYAKDGALRHEKREKARQRILVRGGFSSGPADTVMGY